MVTLSVASHLGGFDLEYSQLEEQERKLILDQACTVIEDMLADAKYLAEFTYNGKQAFYNDETQGSKGYITSGSGDQLCDNFHVTTDAGMSNFIITNSKIVYSSRSKGNLFELLWNGFGPYTVPTTISHSSQEQIAYYMRTKKMQREFYKTGGPFIKTDGAQLMTYYYRYAGEWFYKKSNRLGMDPGLITKFHMYIDRAISRGIEKAIALNTSEDTYQLMRGY